MTDGAVGKKSAKPAEERDIMRYGYKPKLESLPLVGSILEVPTSKWVDGR